MTTEQIVEKLRFPGNAIPEAELAEVMARKEEFVPVLIGEIEQSIRTPVEEINSSDSLAGFALYLLAEMRETRALRPVLEIFALEATALEIVFGDIILQDGSRVLAAIGQDQPEALREFVKRPGLDALVMATVLDALVLQVRWGLQPRDTVAAFFQELMEANQFLNDEEAWSFFVGACLDLHPAGLLEGIRGLYERDIVDESIVGAFEELEKAAQEDPATFYAADNDPRKTPIMRTADEVGWWSIFAGDSEDFLDEEDVEVYGPDDYSPVIDLPAEPIRVAPKIGRNDLCPCGSGKKYKKCCMPAGG